MIGKTIFMKQVIVYFSFDYYLVFRGIFVDSFFRFKKRDYKPVAYIKHKHINMYHKSKREIERRMFKLQTVHVNIKIHKSECLK